MTPFIVTIIISVLLSLLIIKLLKGKKKIIAITMVFILISLIISFFVLFRDNLYLVSYRNNRDYYNTKVIKHPLHTVIERYKDFSYFKIDKIKNTKEITKAELKMLIENSNKIFPYNLIINDDIFLLSEEINMNTIIDYENKAISYNHLNELLFKKGSDKQIDNIYKIELFKTDSKYYSKGKLISLHLNKMGFNKRDSSIIDIDSVINNSAQTLANMCNDNGKYVYGYHANNAEEIPNYNILRHAGATWSLILVDERNNSTKYQPIVENAINYLLDTYMVEDKGNLYLIDDKNEIKLGANALAVLMLSQYQLAYKDDTYLKYNIRLANGIISMQNKDGSFNHILNKDFEVKQKFSIVYYDGESLFALLKLYELINDKKYYEATKKGIDRLIESNYEQYGDHWIAYALYNFLQYNNDDKYSTFALINYSYNNERIDSVTDFKPARFEMLVSTYNSYIYLKNHNKNIDKSFNVNDLEKSIKYHYDLLLNHYFDDEVAMYTAKPDLVRYGFVAITDKYRMRIDDIQHAVAGIINYEKIKN